MHTCCKIIETRPSKAFEQSIINTIYMTALFLLYVNRTVSRPYLHLTYMLWERNYASEMLFFSRKRFFYLATVPKIYSLAINIIIFLASQTGLSTVYTGARKLCLTPPM
jgi:hypothetical protein